MKIIVCIDDDSGILFNNRRQSRDSKVIEDIISSIGKENLRITSFSEKLFADYNIEILTDDIPDNCCIFIEDFDFHKVKDKINECIIYRWNRKYPADKYFDLDLEEMGFKQIFQNEFAGSSHEKITKEIWSL